jgi:hypothetical protein
VGCAGRDVAEVRDAVEGGVDAGRDGHHPNGIVNVFSVKSVKEL